MSNLELLADMAVASCRVVVAMRDLIATIHRESRIPSRRTRMDLVLVEQPTAQSPLNQVCKLQERNALLWRCGMGIVQ